VFVCASEISCTSITFAYKIINVAVELKIYSNIKVKKVNQSHYRPGQALRIPES
jgi:hypothetical protein